MPLSPGEHTLNFSNKQEQFNYFVSKRVYTYSRCTYVRPGVIQCGGYIGEIYDCNYIIYQNDGFSDKYFYGFITRIEYINNTTFQVYFEPDVLQTWLGDYTVTGYIEREHVTSDSATAYILPEPIDGGEMVINNLTGTGVLSGQSIALIATRDGELLFPYNGTLGGRVYSCYDIEYYTTADEVNARLNELKATDKVSDKVLAVYMVPSLMISGVFTYNFNVSKPSRVDGYSPRNLKVLSSLYNKCYMTNGQGSANTLDWDLFSGGASFRIDMSCRAGVPEAMCYPTNYNGSAIDTTHKCVINSFPQCPINTTGYQEWLARQAGRLLNAGAAIAGATGNVGAAVGLGLAGSMVANTQSAKYESGSQSSSIDWSANVLDFYTGQYCIKYAAAQKLDEYFDRYGYHVGRNGTPNTSARPQWNYVKMGSATVKGNIPADDIAEIRRLFESGITFWNNPANVGNYTLSNK